MSADGDVERALRRPLAIRIGVALAVLAVAIVVATMLGGQGEKDAIPAKVATAQPPLPEAQPKAADASAPTDKPLPAEAPSGIGLHADARTASEGGSEIAAQLNESQPAGAGPQSLSEKPQDARVSRGPTADSGGPGASLPPALSGGDKASAQKAPPPADGAQAAAAAALRSPPGAKPPRGPHLQAGVFLQASNAQSFKANLEAQGLPVYIESRVHIGPFRDRKEAERVREQLQEMGVSTVLIGQ
jgi:DedD protein